MASSVFKGFSAATIRFLKELEQNNEREWFQENKQRYESDVREPALAFIQAMEKPLMGISTHFRAIPKKVGGSLMRVYRDTRFAKDKTPYKTNIGIQFRHEYGKDVHAPGFYVHIEAETAFLGVGMWHPESAALGKIRERIVEKPAEWRKVVGAKKFASGYALAGGSLKRAPRGFDADHGCIEDLKRKDFIAVHEFAPAKIRSEKFPGEVTAMFRNASPFMHFLCQAVEVPF